MTTDQRLIGKKRVRHQAQLTARLQVLCHAHQELLSHGRIGANTGMEWRIGNNCGVAAVDAGQPVGGVDHAIDARLLIGRASASNGLKLHVYAVD